MIADLKPYAEHKESGQDWLGSVPAHWSALRAKCLFREVDERSKTGNEELLSVSHLTGVTPRRSKTVTMFLAESNVGHKVCQPGDLVINTLWAWMAALGVARHAGIVSPAYGVYRPVPGSSILPDYADHLLRTPLYAAEYQRCSTGVNSSRLRLYPEQFLRIPVLAPPLAEQADIMRFLSWANERLERAILAKRKVIALLNEQKQAIIHRAVTRGLDPSVPLKPSGIPWLGDIPQHWRTSRLSQLSTRIGDGLHGTPQYVDQSPYYFINGNNLVHGNIRLKSSTRCVNEDEFKRYKIALDNSSVLISINGTIGSVACYRGESIILGKSAAYINCGKGLARPFLFSFLRSPAVINFLRQEVTGTTIFNLSLASIRSLPIALPPVDEQLKIASAIEGMIAPIGTAISRLEREIELLREYRTRLVADVVTGKFDVREAAARLPVEVAPDTTEDNTDLRLDPESADEEAAV